MISSWYGLRAKFSFDFYQALINETSSSNAVISSIWCPYFLGMLFNKSFFFFDDAMNNHSKLNFWPKLRTTITMKHHSIQPPLPLYMSKRKFRLLYKRPMVFFPPGISRWRLATKQQAVIIWTSSTHSEFFASFCWSVIRVVSRFSDRH